MTFTVQQKSQLAKLMATENLSIQHQKIRTAKFDPKNRVLYLPIWQNMSGVMYDLLGGHEVGHALYTPADGWHDAAADKTKGKNYKSFLNVVEDARIEKKVQRKYPGLRVSFRDAYAELNKQDFFGLKNREINTMAFIERLNIYTKSQYTAKISFSPEEQKFVNRIQSLESWDDVVNFTDEIYAYSKQEQFDMQLYDFEDIANLDDGYDGDGDADLDDYNESDEYEDETSEGKPNSESKEKSEEQSEKETNQKGNEPDEGENEGDSDSDDSDKTVNRDKESAPSSVDQFDPSCQTDENFRNNESMLLDEKCREYLYVTLPKANYSNIITPAKRVQELLSEYYSQRIIDGGLTEDRVKEYVNEFKSKNERYISLLAKEFEMRKAAKSFSKSKIADTGDIDINKLSSYKFDDNIFRKVMIVPKGKSHGLILLLDRSGSMSENMAGSIEQILILSMFCRKVNIPFIVYGFGDCSTSNMIDSGLSNDDYHKKSKESFNVKLNDLYLRDVFLREYLNSKMSNAEYSKALRNMILLKKSYEIRNNRYYANYIGQPESENLSNTPMIQAIVALAGVMKAFRKQNNLDMSSLVIVHDGDADNCSAYKTMDTRRNYITNVEESVEVGRGFNIRSTNVILTDRQHKYQRQLVDKPDATHSDILTNGVLDWFRATTESKIFGFFLLSGYRSSVKNAIYNRYVFPDGSDLNQLQRTDFSKKQNEQTRLVKEFKSEKFLISHRPGYDAFYLVSGGSDLVTETEEIEVEGKVTTNKLKNAFMKFNKKKAINRVLVSKFIQGIAA